MLLMLINLYKKIDHENKISDIKGTIPSITGLATTNALTSVKNTTVNDM